ncbi:putative transferase CAF17, mitochondrial [Malaya genurostris]|uniref:putative transferase CAF17, mitochondrial n=1 Tax=Malaya genurostris TaxID=325434 RepID=UPI0026F38FD3|nr:putative transferase CAF17, mitochondrial [Malaya genurostris]
MLWNQKTNKGLINAVHCVNRFIGVRSLPLRKYSDVVLEQLRSRSLLRLHGKDVKPYLQGLITNDMNHFAYGSNSIYAMFLNAAGRVLYDCIIYKMPNKTNDFLLECDNTVLNKLETHLNLFRVRKKVTITSADFDAWVAFNPVSPDCPVPNTIQPEDSAVAVYKDVRLRDLGFRIIANKATTCESLRGLFPSSTNFDHSITYLEHRYGLGVGEGVVNFPPGACFPSESNCDFLHGLSFHKGCYIGQELTARTHHTGVVRKRLMPLFLEKKGFNELELTSDAQIKSKEGEIVGKLRGVTNRVGLGLLRIEKVLNSPSLIIADKIVCTTQKPQWWPVEQ